MSDPQRHMPEDWSAYITRTTPVTVDRPAPCFRCGTPRVADDELGVFWLCPSCSTGSLRPPTVGSPPPC